MKKKKLPYFLRLQRKRNISFVALQGVRRNLSIIFTLTFHKLLLMNRFGDIDYSFKRLPPVYGHHSEELVSLEKALKPIEPIVCLIAET
jgi:hypothetical protein